MLDTIKRDATKFVTSSLFRHGDALSFQVPLIPGEVSLPGRCSPSDYIDSHKLTIPPRVLVYGAGNGGLAVECVNRGATQVTIIETRAAFAGALKKVQELVNERWKAEAHTDGLRRTFDVFARASEFEGVRPAFDLILWPEALDEVKEPPTALAEVRDFLVPGGTFCVEVMHGSHDWVNKINAWKPSAAAFRKGVAATFDRDGEWTWSKIPGRAENRAIYTIVRPVGNTADVVTARVGAAPPAPPATPPLDPPPPAAEAVHPGAAFIEAARVRLEQLVAGRKKAEPKDPLDAEKLEETLDAEVAHTEAMKGANLLPKGYKCGVCDERGHNARTCPTKKAPATQVVKDELRLTDDDDEPIVVVEEEIDFEADFDADLDEDDQ